MKLSPSSLPVLRQPLSCLADGQEFIYRYGYKFLRFAKTSTFVILLYAILASTIFSTAVLNLHVVQVTGSSGTRTVYTFASDPRAILQQSGIHLSQNDQVAFTGIHHQYGHITVLPAFPVQVTADGKTQKVMVATGTVADVLKKAGVQLGENDVINVKPKQAVARGMGIQVTRVRFATSVVQNSIPFQSQAISDASLTQGVRNVLKAGQNGVETVTLRLKYVDGKLTEQTETNRAVVPPVNEQVAVGTASTQSTQSPTKSAKSTTANSASDGIPAYSKVLTGVATAYTQAQGSMTATGREVAKGLVAVDPRKIPYGTKLYIASPDGSYVYGYAVAADTGGFVNNGSGVLTDLFMPTEAQCEAFGRKTVNIYVLK